ncbi:MAG TPA: KpsF/GutQ family sugar-phosphate isomerase [Phycisphaerae bacterium]|nr:KpsF/GutQ family sugar-phosphate isomerase [Phycisphaerae bacterium]HPM24056.1 KpsF/GutQ family sugar-phosphate isomerase [Phycisphaerae bacterium]HQL55020.1 KpsF/GutQ family sugar-phosphate isomerase [Phycisphaerae bacterium]
MNSALEIARQVVADEAEALRQLTASFGADFEAILNTLLASNGQIVVSGLGKSGNIAQKIAASLTSTGTPAVFMHPVEALHGDLGIVTSRNCLIALSRSGNTEEILRFVAHFRRLGGPVIGFTQGRNSRLAELANHLVLLPDVPEAGPLNLAPTTSCVMMLAAGDALAMALLHKRGFKAEDFAQYHPEGALGRRLLLRAADLMHSGAALPVVQAGQTFNELVVEMTRKQLGLALIVETNGRMLGTFTDGDLRRIFERVADPRAIDARTAYAQSRRSAASPPVPISAVQGSHLAVECLRIMRESQITSLVVTDDAGRPVGLLRLMDLLNAGLG